MKLKNTIEDFCGCPVVKNLPATASLPNLIPHQIYPASIHPCIVLMMLT